MAKWLQLSHPRLRAQCTALHNSEKYKISCRLPYNRWGHRINIIYTAGFHFYHSTGIQGDSIGDVKLNKDGDRIGRYSIYQYQKVGSSYKYVWVGEYGEYPNLNYNETTGEVTTEPGQKQELALDVFRMRWPNVTGKDPPKSVCSEPCAMGHVRSYAVSQVNADNRRNVQVPF